jgi:hypothetical protein
MLGLVNGGMVFVMAKSRSEKLHNDRMRASTKQSNPLHATAVPYRHAVPGDGTGFHG